MLFKKLLRTMGQYKAQFISMVIMIGLGIGVFVGFNMEWVSIIENTDYVYEKTNFSDYRIVSETGFSKDAVSKISEIDGVDAASRFISVNVDVKDRPGDLIVQPVLCLIADTLRPNLIFLPDQLVLALQLFCHLLYLCADPADNGEILLPPDTAARNFLFHNTKILFCLRVMIARRYINRHSAPIPYHGTQISLPEK